MKRQAHGDVTAQRRLPGAKNPRAERTRARIREAANKLFLRDGFEATTVDAIVAGAGISKGTFYLHFQHKEDLLLEYGSRRLQRIREMLPDLIGRKTFREAFNEILEAVVLGKSWGREITGLAIQEMGTSAERLPVEAPHELIQPLVELAQARGEIRGDIPPEALARFALRSVLGALRDWGLGHDDTERETAIQYALTLVFDALDRRGPEDS
jgi:AcrR family transcriptional regulator